MFKDPIVRVAIALDAFGMVLLLAGLMGLFAPDVVAGTPLAERQLALGLAVAGGLVWVAAVVMLVPRLLAARRRP